MFKLLLDFFDEDPAPVTGARLKKRGGEATVDYTRFVSSLLFLQASSDIS